MTATTDRQTLALDLSREQQWVVHHVMLDRIELEASAPADTEPPSLAVYRIFEKLEAGTYRFTATERRRLEIELREYLEAVDTPDRDRPVTERVLEQLQESDTDATAAEPSS